MSIKSHDASICLVVLVLEWPSVVFWRDQSTALMGVLDSSDCRCVFLRIESVPLPAKAASQVIWRDHMGEHQSSNDGLIDGKSQKGIYSRPGDEACCFAWI